MIAIARKLLEKERFPVLIAAPVVLLVVFFVLWPYVFFQANARWIGEAFWIAVLILAAMAGLLAAYRSQEEYEEWKRRSQLQEILHDIRLVNSESDQSKFKQKVRSCLNDPSVARYFERNLVNEDDVVEVLADGYALQQAREINSYKIFAHTRSRSQDIVRKNSVISYGAYNFRTATTFVSIFILTTLILIEISQTNLATSGIAFASIISIGIASWLFSSARNKTEHRRRKWTLSFLALCISFCIIILPPVLSGVKWNALGGMFPIWFILLLLCYILPTKQTIDQCLSVLCVGMEQGHLLFLRDEVRQIEAKWLDDCDDIIMEQANLTINTVLGKDKDLFLVEQDSQGLRRLQDPSYTVSTRSEHRIASILAQMDGGSIALAGPRGAGKSTLLRKFSGPLRSNIDDDPGISLYLTAPAEYIPRDFIAAFFQQLCESYLAHEQVALPKPIDKERLKLDSRRVLGSISKFLWLFARTVILVAIIAWIMRSLISTHYHYMYETTLTTFKHWYKGIYHLVVNESLYKRIKPYWPWIRILILILAVIEFLSISGRWKNYTKPRGTKPRRKSTLSTSAREYLRRLQIEKTVTWGRGASIGMPTGRGLSLNLNRGGTASYLPWTLPELVEHTRRFMQGISQQFRYSRNAVVVGIDEIDRIGSLDHAEKFVNEIKAIFGIDKCFFLVAVAEDVGSVFAQRATAGRSVLENAFDDIVLVEPLDFEETRDLLLKRVPGFTDSFVYLVHALSGGLPRELLRITRRLVDINKDASTNNQHPRLHDLAFCLVREELIEAIRATRNHLARLMLHSNWTSFFEKVHSASTSLRRASPFSVYESSSFIKELSELKVPDTSEALPTRRELVIKDEDEAERIVRDFTAFSYFGLTIIEAFNDKIFDLGAVQEATASGSEVSYEKLAVARAELIVSPENSRAMLRRFNVFLLSRYND